VKVLTSCNFDELLGIVRKKSKVAEDVDVSISFDDEGGDDIELDDDDTWADVMKLALGNENNTLTLRVEVPG
jgi:hypothetical protein